MQTVSPSKQQGGSLLVLVVTGGIAGAIGIALNSLFFAALEQIYDVATGDMFVYRLYFLVALLFFLFVMIIVKKCLPNNVEN